MFANILKADNILFIAMSILATYRLAQFIAYDDAPFGLMYKARNYFGRKAANSKNYGFWWSIAEMINCPFCLGLWIALLIALIVNGFQPYSILLWLAIAGGQAWIENMALQKQA